MNVLLTVEIDRYTGEIFISDTRNISNVFSSSTLPSKAKLIYAEKVEKVPKYFYYSITSEIK